MLLKPEQVRQLLVSPCCLGELADDLDRLTCKACGRAYDIIDGWPVLIQFGDSIVPPELAQRTPSQEGAFQNVHPDVARNLRIVRSLLHENARLLVVGGASNAHGLPFYDDPTTQVVAFDIKPSEITQFVADAHRVPLPDASVDAVIVQAVLEHVLDPAQVVREVHRVLAPQGLVYAETPFLQQVHEAAYDFTRFTESGHRWLFREFSLIESGPIGGPGLQAQWTIDYLMRGLSRRKRLGAVTRKFTGWLRWLDRFVPRPHRIDSAAAVYFIGRASDSSIKPEEMRSYYQGAQ